MENHHASEQNSRPSIGDEITSIESNEEIIRRGKERISEAFERYKAGDITRGEYDLRTDAVAHEIDAAMRAMKTSKENVDSDMTGEPFTVSQRLARFVRKHL